MLPSTSFDMANTCVEILYASWNSTDATIRDCDRLRYFGNNRQKFVANSASCRHSDCPMSTTEVA
jgi:hypothetical protein